MNVDKAKFRYVARGVGAKCVKFGEFILKSGKPSPVYIDLRLIRSYPWLIRAVAEMIVSIIEDSGIEFDLIADVPTAGTPIATLVSQILNVPMITPRSDKKDHGSGAKIDGDYKKGQRVFLIDDLITGADSKLEATNVIEGEGLIVAGVAVLINREQGGVETMAKAGYTVLFAFTMRELLDQMLEDETINSKCHKEVIDFFFPNK
jgi:uridine monophosphate synthetase